MACELNTVELTIPLVLGVIFLTMALTTFFVVDKRKKERMHIGQTYYMSMDMVGGIIMVGAVLSLSIMLPLGRTLGCMYGWL